MAPLGATVYECERWRCNLCGEVFTAPAPEGVGPAKYDATATSMVGLLKYGCGLPFHRIEVLQRAHADSAARRHPVGTRARRPAASSGPPGTSCLRQAAQGEVLYNDDTTMKVLALTAEQRRAAAADEETDARTGVFTSGIVATGDGHHIALFFTGRQHAGENLADVLAQRAAELRAPDPDVRRARRQHRGRLRHDPRRLPRPCAPPLRRRRRALPGGGPARARGLARGLPHRRPGARARALPRGAPAPPPDHERPA